MIQNFYVSQYVIEVKFIVNPGFDKCFNCFCSIFGRFSISSWIPIFWISAEGKVLLCDTDTDYDSFQLCIHLLFVVFAYLLFWRNSSMVTLKVWVHLDFLIFYKNKVPKKLNVLFSLWNGERISIGNQYDSHLWFFNKCCNQITHHYYETRMNELLLCQSLTWAYLILRKIM